MSFGECYGGSGNEGGRRLEGMREVVNKTQVCATDGFEHLITCV